jgi:hypothetical protein
VRPNRIEALRGVQQGLASSPAAEAGAAFAEDAVRTSQMLLESVIGELAAGDEEAVAGGEALRDILARGAEAVRAHDGALAGEIAAALADSRVAAETLSGLLERLLVAAEDAVAAGEAAEPLLSDRSEAYRHLRRVEAGGWSFWDMASFRERMARFRADGG